MTRKKNVFEQYVEDKIIFLDSLRNKTIGELIDFMDKNPNVKIFDWISNNTSHSLKHRRGYNISNNMKLRCIGVGIGLVAGLVAACCLWQDTLALIGGSGVVLIAFAIVGALLGAGASYVVGKCLDKIEVSKCAISKFS
ncbi:hypothetical protein C1A_294 [Wolbachia endosymbiont of Culex quinquefasciatus JHB]|uniref:hypothetical protein n=1 Tax=unclassified Wolbachia TaxID=2640676 RepID=UPI0001761E89|nr:MULTISPECIES: hypothetical protein [unclassified Wolbachia]EEB56112.1 hypothetical protein C1A_294 [Wolbachia endosymbiont of Culex quinquefasciatus JHB]CAQ54823.1 Hypotehtical protein [Wolbachia endosymbiont of Culex quinquefasciatus Pel]CQD08913.1 Uncharacterised protein [Wolbachia endosymbiont wPip_Mol of Culex molestus]